jgi:hypothetical protein
MKGNVRMLSKNKLLHINVYKIKRMRWPSLVYGVIFEISSINSAASSNLAPSDNNKLI